MQLINLQDALVAELKALLSAEQQISKALPLMAQKASTPQLRQSFEMHLEQTHNHILRLEQAFSMLGEQVKPQTCKAVQGIIAEGRQWMQEDTSPQVMDALLIAVGQKVEHYEVASYGTVCTWAEQLGQNDLKDLLGQTLEEEKLADQKLSDVALQRVNISAV